MKNINEILVSNYKLGFFNKPIKEVFPNARMEWETAPKNSLAINESLFIHVFDTIPNMRNIPVNRQWFETNLYHFNKI